MKRLLAAIGVGAVAMTSPSSGGCCVMASATSRTTTTGTEKKLDNNHRAAPSSSAASSTSSRRPALDKAAAGGGPYISKASLPASDHWTSIEEGVEFLPSHALFDHDTTTLPPSLHRQLRSQLTNPYSVQPFVSGESEYDEYQQAWRYLGFVIDCDSNMDDDSSWDGGTGEGCQRYLIWAAVSRFCWGREDEKILWLVIVVGLVI